MSLLLNRNVFKNAANSGNVLLKEDAMQLLKDWVLNERLRLHMMQVAEKCMRLHSPSA